MVERIIGSEMVQVQFDLVDTDDLVNTGRGVADITDLATRIGLPTLRGAQGFQGVPGQSLVVLGTKATTNDLPPLSNTISDWGKAYWIGTALYAWNGTAWVPSPNLQGPVADPAMSRVTDRGVWTAATVYAYGDVVTAGSQRWLVKVPHTSGSTFSGATNWVPLGLSRHAIVVTRNYNQSQTTDTWAGCVWNGSAGDVDRFVISGSQVTPLVAGLYSVHAQITYTAGGNNVRGAAVWKNGGVDGKYAGPASGPYPGNVASSGLAAGTSSGTALVAFNGTTDYVEGCGWHNNGSNLSMDPGLSNSLRMTLQFLHP